jgi:hypothetical protein
VKVEGELQFSLLGVLFILVLYSQRRTKAFKDHKRGRQDGEKVSIDSDRGALCLAEITEDRRQGGLLFDCIPSNQQRVTN